jgi:hypothetical protein
VIAESRKLGSDPGVIEARFQGTAESRLRRLMQEHVLRQRDLPDAFRSRGIASEVVSGKGDQ